MPLLNAARDLRLLRKHFRLRRLSRRRFRLEPRTGDALDYILDLDLEAENVYSKSCMVGQGYLLDLIGDWTDDQSVVYQRRLMSQWLAPTASPPPAGPHYAALPCASGKTPKTGWRFAGMERGFDPSGGTGWRPNLRLASSFEAGKGRQPVLGA